MGFGRRRANTVTVLALTALLAAACDDGPTEPESDGAEVVLAVLSMSVAQRPVSSEGPGAWEYACPSGGRFVVEGETSLESEDGVSVHRWDHVMAYEDCAMTVEGSEAVANGEMHVVGEARFGPPADGSAPILTLESSQVGSMTMSYRGETTTCDYDVTHAYLPEDEEYRVRGMVCGRSVDVRVPVPQNPNS